MVFPDCRAVHIWSLPDWTAQVHICLPGLYEHKNCIEKNAIFSIFIKSLNQMQIDVGDLVNHYATQNVCQNEIKIPSFIMNSSIYLDRSKVKLFPKIYYSNTIHKRYARFLWKSTPHYTKSKTTKRQFIIRGHIRNVILLQIK